MYNNLFGMSRYCPILISVFGLVPSQVAPDAPYAVPRLRDCYLGKDRKHIVVYTRAGGANRETYMKEIERLRAHPCYMNDEDDETDSTYAYFRFRAPDSVSDIFDELPDEAVEGMNIGEKFLDLAERMKDASRHPEKIDADAGLKRALAFSETLRKQIKSAEDDGANVIVIADHDRTGFGDSGSKKTTLH